MRRSSAIRHSPQLPLSALSQGRSDTERTRQATVTEIREESIGELARHGEISIAFQVDSVFEVRLQEQGLGGVQFTERPGEAPWFKDYDTNDGGPERWSERFDVSRWGLLGAYQGDRRIGGAVIAFDTPDLHMLRGRGDQAVLWDLRVDLESRRSGVATALFKESETWARRRGCTVLEVETQQVNVPACRFYARMGCSLAAVDRFAYDELPDEVQLIWRRELQPDP
jgi:GNAT superfamily N-acetyltransferase